MCDILYTVMKKKINIKPASSIALSFAGVILVGTLLFCLPISHNNGQWFSFVDSFLTSTSCVCVTGLTVIDLAVNLSLFGQIVAMILIQIGGLGFITISALAFILLGKKISYKNRITLQESLNQESSQGVVILVKKIVLVVICIELIGALLILPSICIISGFNLLSLFKSIFLAISAFCNAGFDVIGTEATQMQSLAPFAQNTLLLLPIMLLVVVGGIGYTVLFDIGNKAKNKSHKMSFHSKLVISITLFLIFGGAVVFAICEWNNPLTIGNMNIFDKIVNSFFQGITPRTAGFATFDQSHLTPISRILTNLLMFIGGSPASTAGGIKTTTFFIILLFVFTTPNDKNNYIVKQRQVSSKTMFKALKIVTLSLTIIVVSTILLAILEPTVELNRIIFEVISAISTVGLSTSLTPTLGTFSKIILSFLMYLGRIGTITFTIAIANKKIIQQEINYQDAKLMVG